MLAGDRLWQPAVDWGVGLSVLKLVRGARFALVVLAQHMFTCAAYAKVNLFSCMHHA
jgi:hypothetical protein